MFLEGKEQDNRFYPVLRFSCGLSYKKLDSSCLMLLLKLYKIQNISFSCDNFGNFTDFAQNTILTNVIATFP